MVRHNNVVPYAHFHKNWARRVKTWLHQPAQKKIRRDKRKEKAAKLAPRPASGNLKPLVHCPTQKYNAKVKFGRGFSLEELKEAGINRQYAKTVGISVDHRRINKSNESLKTNVDRLKEYKARLVVFPKKSDVNKEMIGAAPQLFTKPKASDSAVTFTEVTDELKGFKAYATLRKARADAKLVGIRLKKSKESKDEKPAAPAKGADDE